MHYEFRPDEWKEGDEKVELLYRPGHYDILCLEGQVYYVVYGCFVITSYASIAMPWELRIALPTMTHLLSHQYLRQL